MKLSPKLPPPELNGLDWLYGPLRLLAELLDQAHQPEVGARRGI